MSFRFWSDRDHWLLGETLVNWLCSLVSTLSQESILGGCCARFQLRQYGLDLSQEDEEWMPRNSCTGSHTQAPKEQCNENVV